jgi:hypothetical protein
MEVDHLDLEEAILVVLLDLEVVMVVDLSDLEVAMAVDHLDMAVAHPVDLDFQEVCNFVIIIIISETLFT